MDRRYFITAASALAVLSACNASDNTMTPNTTDTALTPKQFPDGFLWGASTAGHQVEGQNVNSDLWYLENLTKTAFAEPSGDGVNSFNLWETDLDLVREMGLNTYRFSVEWARIEPTEGAFDQLMMDHYKNIIAGCHARGLTPIVTFNHFTSPLWFSADGGWTNDKAPARFAKYCSYVAAQIGDDIAYALTFNEPQILPLLARLGLPDFVQKKTDIMLAQAEKDMGVAHFSTMNVARKSDIALMQKILIKGHIAGREAIKKAAPNLPVGVSIAIFDDQEGEENSLREQVRRELYEPWLEVAKQDDFLGVQNYERKIWGKTGAIKPPKSKHAGLMGAEVYPPSLAGAVRYAYAQTGVPILVTEHGVGTQNDATRAWMIPQALQHLKTAIDEGVPVIGYCHWSLLDNFEWVFGYGPKFGLIAVDRSTFERTPKPSSKVYGAIARVNALP